jgi:glutaminyl-peptide cyclotransferase
VRGLLEGGGRGGGEELNRAGIPAIDVIDFDYPHWHRLSDTPDKCSAESMVNVAKVLMAWLERVK